MRNGPQKRSNGFDFDFIGLQIINPLPDLARKFDNQGILQLGLLSLPLMKVLNLFKVHFLKFSPTKCGNVSIPRKGSLLPLQQLEPGAKRRIRFPLFLSFVFPVGGVARTRPRPEFQITLEGRERFGALVWTLVPRVGDGGLPLDDLYFKIKVEVDGLASEILNEPQLFWYPCSDCGFAIDVAVGCAFIPIKPIDNSEQVFEPACVIVRNGDLRNHLIPN